MLCTTNCLSHPLIFTLVSIIKPEPTVFEVHHKLSPISPQLDHVPPPIETDPLAPVPASPPRLPKLLDFDTESGPQLPYKPSNRKEELPPLVSDVVTKESLTSQGLPTQMNKAQREQWLKDTVPTPVQLLLDQPFGKPNNNQTFYSEVTLRHVVPFLSRSEFLSRRDKDRFQVAYHPAKVYNILWRRYRPIEFHQLREPNLNWEQETEFDQQRVDRITACFLHFNFDTAAVVRYIGGQHVASHRDTENILGQLKGIIDENVWNDLARLFRDGAPAYCNAESTEENFIAFYQYGNHKSTYQKPDVTMKALVKDFKKSYCLATDDRVLLFLPHAHPTPLGMVYVFHKYKKARPVFDSTHHPKPDSFAINDWTSKENEPELVFPLSQKVYYTWLWNLRITYPRKEIYPGDDDVQGAFRHAKYNPLLVALHCIRIFGFLILMTGCTFGDNTSPQNFEPIARARSQFAQWIWKSMQNLLELAAPYIPACTFAAPPTAAEVDTFTTATPDSKNTGVIDDAGQRIPPPYPHHVDDCMYADVKEYMPQTIAASVYSLYTILGFPQPHLPDPLSHDKLVTHYNHQRVACGRKIDTRRLSVGMTDVKRDQLVEQIREFLLLPYFTLLQAASIAGLLSDAARICRWAWPLFFGLRNLIAKAIRDRFIQAQAVARRRGFRQELEAELPVALWKRIDKLVSKKVASYVWANNVTMKHTQRITGELEYICQYLEDPSNRWEISIGHVIDRDHTWQTAGDASHVGGGALCYDLEFIIDCRWSDSLRHAIHLDPKDDRFVHINHLEFVVILLQYAAVIQLIEDGEVLLANSIPILLALTDNMTSKKWAHKATADACAFKGQRLVACLTAMLQRSNLGANAEWIEGVTNTKPDFVSRLSPTLSFPERRAQILTMDTQVKSWRCFQPSPELVSLLSSLLSSAVWTGRPSLPSSLGRFDNVSSTSSISFDLSI